MRMLRSRALWLHAMIFLTPLPTFAQDSQPGLARPEWQMRADLEFRLACQASLQRLCLELIETQSTQPSDPENAKFLAVAKKLLETTDGKIPPTLPEHPASAKYAQSRKSAFLEWTKAYKAKGRELPTGLMDKERKFQESFRDNAAAAANAGRGESANASKQAMPPATESKDNRTAGKGANSAEKKLEEVTIKSLVSLIKEVDKYRSTKPAGDTTLEREQSKRIAKDLLTKYVDNLPDCYLTYPIKDVSGGSDLLYFDVEEPVEFQQIRKEPNANLLLIQVAQSIAVKNVEIGKLSSSIKPGDYLRVRFKVLFRGFDDLQYSSNALFAVKHSAVVGDPSFGNGQSLFQEKSKVGYQLVKKSAMTERTK